MTRSIPRDADGDELPLIKAWQARTKCPPPDLLLAAQDESVLSEPLGAAVRAHAAACPLCGELMTALEDGGSDPTVEEVRRIDERLRFQTGGRRRWWPSMAAAAALITVAAGLYLARTNQPPSAPAGPAPSAPAQPQVPRQPVLTLAAPAIMLPPESLTLRGEARSAYASALEDALAPFADGNYQDAVARLEKVTRDHPRRPHAEFYDGVARLLNGAAAEAVAPLQRARDLAPKGSPLSDEATWYLAVALERSNQGEAAAGPLTDICGGTGPRQAQACEGLRLLSKR